MSRRIEQICKDRIERRIALRAKAQEYIELIGIDTDFSSAMTHGEMEVFWRELISHSPLAHLREPPEEQPVDEPMSEAESKRFGGRTMTFGKYVGETVDNIPRDYLEWFADQPDEFKGHVRRYLQSNRVKNEIEHEGTL